MASSHALVIDDEPDICHLLTFTLNKMGIEAMSVQTISEAKKMLRAQSFDICLTDLRLPDGNGLSIVNHLQTHYPTIPVAVITAHGNMETAIKALKLGAFDFISKPIDLNQFRSTIQEALKTHSTIGLFFSPQLIGESDVMQKLRNNIAKVIRSQAPIFISGPSGSGKELVARIIHQSGSRRAGPFIPVNCGAIPQELMESEFFGHLKGSFTGAMHDKIGFFQAANNGTLFLDEVADLPLTMQVKLLRAIQEKKIRPIGSPQEIPVDVRILSATHKNLHLLVQQNLFRHDLFYRIHVIEIEVPSLGERKEDILLLANYFLTKHFQNPDKTIPKLSDDAKKILLRYSFPGNVRELENIIERSIVLSNGKIITQENLQLPLSEPSSVSHSNNPSSLDDYLIEKEREMILHALAKHHGNKTATAKSLGVSFRTLRYRIKKLGMKEDPSSE